MTLDDAIDRLGRISILAAASRQQLAALAAASSWRQVNDGEEIISHLATETHIYFVSEGALRVKLEPLPGRGVEIRIIEAGQHVGEIAALAGAPRSVTVTAEGAGLLAKCPAEAFFTVAEENGAIGLAVAASLARMVISLTDRLFQTAALEVRFRIYAEILRLAKSAEPSPDGFLIRKAPTHDMIAKTVGTHREAVTKEYRHLADERILRQNRRELVILDLEKLRDLVRKHAGLTASQIVDW